MLRQGPGRADVRAIPVSLVTDARPAMRENIMTPGGGALSGAFRTIIRMVAQC